MTDSLMVQRDDIGNVVRLLTGDTPVELSPAEAQDLGEQLIRHGRELDTTQATLDDLSTDDQQTLAEINTTPDRESLTEMRERVAADDEAPVEWPEYHEDNQLEW